MKTNPSSVSVAICKTGRPQWVAVRKDRHEDVTPTRLDVLENRVATKIPLLSAFASGYGATVPL